ncbi:MAG: hypothetical protein EXR67_06710 [Dehalococcoidia bacterium]|nr:hypothetical protein [Dehalococcoidia bacterium]
MSTPNSDLPWWFLRWARLTRRWGPAFWLVTIAAFFVGYFASWWNGVGVFLIGQLLLIMSNIVLGTVLVKTGRSRRQR